MWLHDEYGERCRDTFANGCMQVPIYNKHTGAAVLQDVPDFLTFEMPVDRNEVRADVTAGEHHLQCGGAVSQHQRENIAIADAGTS